MKALVFAFGVFLLTQSAWAVPLTFMGGSQADFDSATRCIFTGSSGGGGGGCPLLGGGTGPAPADTPTGAPGASYSDDSFTYTVAQLITALGGDNQFNVVFDSNWSNSTPGDSDFLDLFQVYVNGVVEFDYIGSTAMDDGANGTGNENWMLSTVDLSTFQLTDTVYFHLEMSGLTDGFEQVALSAAGFVDPCPFNPLPGCPTNPIPEPGILVLLGTGLLGLALGRRKLS